MRINLSITGRDDVSRDVEVLGRGPATLSELKENLPLECGVGCDAAIFNEGRLVLDQHPLGTKSLLGGAELSTRRQNSAAEATTLRLNVDAGPDAGASFPLPRGRHIVGRSVQADIVINDPDLSRQHLVLDVGLHAVSVRDLNSTNGTSCAGSPIKSSGQILLPETSIIAGHSQLSLSGPGEPPAVTELDSSGQLRVYRPPKSGESWRPHTLDMPGTPADLPRPKLSLLAAVIPALASVALAVVFHSPQLLAFAALSPVSVIASAFSDRRSWRRTKVQQQKDHEAKRAMIIADVEHALAEEDAALRRSHPGPSVLSASVRGPDCRLWELRRSDKNFLQVRVGLGDTDSQTSIRREGKCVPAGSIPLAPVTADLKSGVLGVAGPLERARAVGRFVAAQLLTRHSPADLQLIVLVDPTSSQAWSWLRWAEGHLHSVVRAEAERAAVMENLLICMDERLRSSGSDGDRWTGSWTVLIVDPCLSIAQLPRVDELVEKGHKVGISAICLADTARGLPKDCSTTLEVDPDADGWARLSGVERRHRQVSIDGVSRPWCDRLARGLTPLRDAGESGSTSLPSEQRLSDVLDGQSFDEDSVREGGPGTAR